MCTILHIIEEENNAAKLNNDVDYKLYLDLRDTKVD